LTYSENFQYQKLHQLMTDINIVLPLSLLCKVCKQV